MSRRAGAAAGWIALLAAAGGGCRPGPAPLAPGRLALEVDAAASLRVDGRAVGALAPGERRWLEVEQGEHLVALASSGGEAGWEETVEVRAEPVTRTVKLAPAVAQLRRSHVRIPAGSFEMGCVDGDARCEDNEKPRHRVRIRRDFWMMRTEVTVGAYQAFAARTGRPMPEESDINPGWTLADHPMMNLTWDDAVAFCEESGGRLPTEAEWEYAARAGHSGWRHVWGDAAMPVVHGRKQANVGDERTKARMRCPRCGWLDGYDDGNVYTAAVASFAPNDFGLFDMAGNVLEWTADWYRDRSYDLPDTEDPRGSEFGRWRVLRGGSWSINPVGLRVSYRVAFPPHRTTDNYGVRCARDVAAP